MNTDEEVKEIEKEEVKKFDFEILNKFLENNQTFVSNEPAAVLFSLGVLVRLVFNIQQKKLNNTPFEKKLKGLQLSERDVNRIFTEAVEKINEYGKIYWYKDLREFISQKLIENKNEIEKMPNQEISFNFVAGLELGNT